MIRRPTVVYIIVLLVVISAYLTLRMRGKPAEKSEATPQASAAVSYLFAPEEGSPSSIFIQAKSGETVELARNAENAWALKQPVEAAAEQAGSEAAASQVTTMRILEQVPNIDPGAVGLKDPDYILKVKFTTGMERTVRIGVVTPTESGYYVQAAGSGEVQIVSKSSVDALLRLLATPPYRETPTPAPDLLGTGTASPGLTAPP